MSVFDKIEERITDGVRDALTQAGEEICDNMRDKLTADGHAGTGELLSNITSETTIENGKISVSIHMPEYAKFIDSGTGAAHGVPGGRVGSWSYQDRDGNWHTTDGMDADPFIDISKQQVVDKLTAMIDAYIKQRW